MRITIGKVEVSGGFLLLAAWLYYQDNSGVIWQGVLACLLHEAGHCLALWYLGIHIRRICLTVFGAKIIFGNSLSYCQEFFAAAAGPGVNLLLAYLFCSNSAGQTFAGFNFALAVFNLLPIGSLDGARMLRCVLAGLFSNEFAFLLSGCLDICFTVLFLSFGILMAVYGGNLTLFLMCFWLLKRSLCKKTLKFSRKEWD